MDGADDVWARLRDLTERVAAMADYVTLVVVANRHDGTLDGSTDRATEHFTDSETSQLLGGFRAAGFRTRYFEGERAFMSAVLDRPRLDIGTRHVLVYNVAQSGTDPGRKSLVPAFCALNGLPTCNSNSYCLSLARNKIHVHAVLATYGLPTPATWVFRAGNGWLRGERPPGDVELIAKACHESASIGLDEKSVGTLSGSYEEALAHKSELLGQPMVVQRLIRGLEMETPVVELAGRGQVLGPAVITLSGDDRLDGRILDYDAISHDAYGFAVPAGRHAAAVARIGQVAPAVFEVLGLSGFARVDFRVDQDGGVHVIDVSTTPHLVWHSAYAHVFREAGWAYEGMIASMVAVNAARLGWL